MSCRSQTLTRYSFIVLCALLALPHASLADHTAEHALTPAKTSSPRATLQSFIRAMEAAYRAAGEDDGRAESVAAVQRAVRHLDTSELPASVAEDRATEAALMLKEVLDRIALPPTDEIPGKDQAEQITRWRVPHTEIRIRKVDQGLRRGEFLFTPDTVERAGDFYERVRRFPYEDGATPRIYEAYVGTPGDYLDLDWGKNLPEWARRVTGSQSLWQHVAGWGTIFFVIFAVYRLLVWGRRWDKRTTTEDGERRFGRIAALLLAITLLAGEWWLVDEVINTTGMLLVIYVNATIVVVTILVSWLVSLLLAEMADAVVRHRGYVATGAHGQLVRLGAQLLALVLIVAIALFGANLMGLPAYSVIAGLGVGGLAVALAAQQTLTDLIGSLTILSERPYTIGDWVVLGEHEGTVEGIGARSTRLRTFYDSSLSIPNAKASSMAIDNMGRRNYRRVNTTFDIRADTPSQKVDAFLVGIKDILSDNRAVRQDFQVAVTDLANASLTVMLYFFLKVPTWAEELTEREKIFLQMIRLAESLDVDFAPTNRVEMVPEAEPRDESD